MKRDVIFRRSKSGNAGAVGIIGGADGPTTVFVTGRTKPELHPILRFARFVACAACVAASICLWRGASQRAK